MAFYIFWFCYLCLTEEKGFNSANLKKIAQIEGDLNQDEKVILHLILDHYPSPIELPEVLAKFAPELTFESRVKKFRKSIKYIESVVQQKTNFKNAVFIHSKNKEDKRIKEIGITKEK